MRVLGYPTLKCWLIINKAVDFSKTEIEGMLLELKYFLEMASYFGVTKYSSKFYV
jgi:hypothetical protein